MNTESYKGINGNYEMNCLLNDVQSYLISLIGSIEREHDFDLILGKARKCNELIYFAIDNTELISEKEKVKPRTKEAYEKVEDAIAGECLYVKIGDKYSERLVIGNHPHHPCIVVEDGDENINTVMLSDLYRKVTKPIEWWEDACEHVKCSSSDDWELEVTNEGKVMRMTAEMTRDQWCDFARILLEQGE